MSVIQVLEYTGGRKGMSNTRRLSDGRKLQAVTLSFPLPATGLSCLHLQMASTFTSNPPGTSLKNLLSPPPPHECPAAKLFLPTFALLTVLRKMPSHIADIWTQSKMGRKRAPLWIPHNATGWHSTLH
ncbi:unnamed protein product [Lepidochelys kempii]